MFQLTPIKTYHQQLIFGVTINLLLLCYAFFVLRILSRKMLGTHLD